VRLGRLPQMLPSSLGVLLLERIELSLNAAKSVHHVPIRINQDADRPVNRDTPEIRAKRRQKSNQRRKHQTIIPRWPDLGPDQTQRRAFLLSKRQSC
jgi:hypothetical protein